MNEDELRAEYDIEKFMIRHEKIMKMEYIQIAVSTEEEKEDDQFNNHVFITANPKLKRSQKSFHRNDFIELDEWTCLKIFFGKRYKCWDELREQIIMMVTKYKPERWFRMHPDVRKTLQQIFLDDKRIVLKNNPDAFKEIQYMRDDIFSCFIYGHKKKYFSSIQVKEEFLKLADFTQTFLDQVKKEKGKKLEINTGKAGKCTNVRGYKCLKCTIELT